MGYLFGSGWWILWYLLLWSAAAPFVLMGLALGRAAPGWPSPGLDTAFALGSVALVFLMGATLVSSVLWTAAGPQPGLWVYLRNLLLAAGGALLLGLLGVFPATYYVASHTYPLTSRWGAFLICAGAVSLLLAFCLHATWRFRQS